MAVDVERNVWVLDSTVENNQKCHLYNNCVVAKLGTASTGNFLCATLPNKAGFQGCQES